MQEPHDCMTSVGDLDVEGKQKHGRAEAQQRCASRPSSRWSGRIAAAKQRIAPSHAGGRCSHVEKEKENVNPIRRRAPCSISFLTSVKTIVFAIDMPLIFWFC